jgi:hypothetical protein
MNFRSSGLVACLLAAVTVIIASCGTVTASSSQTPGALSTSTGAPSGCQHPTGNVVTLASNGKTYCVKVGEKFDVYLRGTEASRWLVPLASSDAIKTIPNGGFSLIAGLTGASFSAARPGSVFITSLRPPCAGAITQKNEAEPAFPVPKTYPLHACAPQRRFIVTVIVLS